MFIHYPIIKKQTNKRPKNKRKQKNPTKNQKKPPKNPKQNKKYLLQNRTGLIFKQIKDVLVQTNFLTSVKRIAKLDFEMIKI